MPHPPDSPTASLSPTVPVSITAGSPRSTGWNWQVPLLILSLAVYLAVRLIGLDRFPIYFFSDEAIQTLLAADLVRDHFHGYTLEFLPTYFSNGGQYNLGTSVYLQVLPYLLFGKSIWVTRGTAALTTLLAALAVGLALKNVFNSRIPWLGVLILSATPAWFLHSRTAFETSLATSFYAGFLYCYLMYRSRSPSYIYPAVLLAALTYYSYSPARLILAGTLLLLFISDFKYHQQQRRTLLKAGGLALLLALPYFRFLIEHPGEETSHLVTLGSYWVADRPLGQKIGMLIEIYLSGLDPRYWAPAHPQDLVRHTMLGYGHLLRPLLPFTLIGFCAALYRFRSSAQRTLLAAVLAAPLGAAPVALGVTRVMCMVIPAALLTALGIETVIGWLARLKLSLRLLISAALVGLLAANLYMTWDVLTNAPTWSNDYGLTGLQYGARQVFGEINRKLNQDHQLKIVVTPVWANGTDILARFFLGDPLPVEMNSPRAYIDEYRPIGENTLFVMTPAEFKELPSNYFSTIQVERILSTPNGQPGFYFVRLKYVENIQALITEQQSANHAVVTEMVPLGMQIVKITHNRLDMGKISDLFDHNASTLIRSAGINPLELDLSFENPISFQQVLVGIGGNDTTITAQVWQARQEEPLTRSVHLLETPLPRTLTVNFGQPLQVTRLHLEISNTREGANDHVHVWDLTFQ